MTNLTRTDNPNIRAQQWARMSEATIEIGNALDAIRTLRSYLARARDFQALEWAQPTPSTQVLRAVATCIKSAASRLAEATQACSSLQSELESLQTALSGQESEDE